MITIEYIQRLRNKAKVYDDCESSKCPFDESVLCVCECSEDQIMLPDVEIEQASHVCQHSLNELIRGYNDCLKIPISFKDCQITQCKDCKFSKDIPNDKACLSNYYDYCKHRNEFAVQERS